MFFTTEYRRGLIRLTLAATPRRGRVLAAKAIVAGAVAFVAALAAAVLCVALGVPRQRARACTSCRSPGLTEARVFLGTAAMAGLPPCFAVALGSILRRSAAAVTAAVVLVVLPFLLAVAVLPNGIANWVLRLTPAAGWPSSRAFRTTRRSARSTRQRAG